MRPSKQRAADVVLYAETVLTVDSDNRKVEAVALQGNRILATGTRAYVDGWVDSRTQVRDLGDACVIPGIIDNHVHLALAGLDLPQVGVKAHILRSPSIAKITEDLRDQVARTPPGEWVVSSCMFRGGLDEGRFPNRDDLDAVSTDHPIYLMQSGKNIIVNSLALEMAGIDEDVDDPTDPEGHFVREKGGRLTGHLIAGAADQFRKQYLEQKGQRPIMWDFLIYPAETKQRAIREMMGVYNACGVTSCREMGLSVDELQAYAGLRNDGDMTVRVNAMLGLPARYLTTEDICRAIDGYFGPMQGFGDEWLRVGGLKMVMHNDGYWSLSRQKMEAVLYEANRQGWTMAIHVGSPEAAELVIELLETADRERPLAGRRFSIEHRYQRFDPDAYRRLAEWGITIAANPQLTYRAAGRAFRMHQVMNQVRIMKDTDEDGWTRAVRWYGLPLRDWWDCGINVTGGTDNPAVAYETERPLLGYYQAVTGETEAGVLLPGQQLSREEALRAFTANNAFATFEEDRKGSLEAGKLADLTVLSRNPLNATPDELLDTQVLLTMVDGRTVYER